MWRLLGAACVAFAWSCGIVNLHFQHPLPNAGCSRRFYFLPIGHDPIRILAVKVYLAAIETGGSHEPLAVAAS